MFERWITDELLAAVRDTPVVFVCGPRQAGKTTLMRTLADSAYPAAYVTLDDLAELAAAQADPKGLVERVSSPVIFDEVQRVPDLLLAIKESVDRDRQPGSFLLTGSAQVLLLPRIAESLVGRVELLTLWPLSQGEIEGRREQFIENIFATKRLPSTELAVDRSDLIDRVLRGGFPDAVARKDDRRRRRWFDDYITTLAQRDIRELANIERLHQIPQILFALALRVRGTLNRSDLSGALGIPRSSLDRYLALLEQVFLVYRVPGWHRKPAKQLVKAPKYLLSDSGLLAHLLGADRQRLQRDDSLLGIVVENFVGMEIVKQLSQSELRTSLYHLRSAKGAEIDFVLEAPDGCVAGVEVKLSASPTQNDFKHLASLRDGLGKRFARGVVLYSGSRMLSFGDRLEAWPLTAVWG